MISRWERIDSFLSIVDETETADIVTKSVDYGYDWLPLALSFVIRVVVLIENERLISRIFLIQNIFCLQRVENKVIRGITVGKKLHVWT